jgi:glutamyl-tRNA synthetase
MRVEDLDPGRVRERFLTGQLEDLRWLGLDWDEGPDVGGRYGPYLQSLRQHLYEKALERLGEQGLVYPCVCSRREIAASASAPHAGEEGPPYPGSCSRREARSADEAPAALRFRVPPGPVHFHDELQGPQTFVPEVETGDFVVRRKDGVAAYQLAVVVDDVAMEITHVLRGADLLSSTARQILLYHALERDPPRWLHVPLLMGEDGERLSKRHGVLSLRELREARLEPERVVGWLAFSCGLAEPDEMPTPAELLDRYDARRLPRTDTVVALPSWARRGGREGASP